MNFAKHPEIQEVLRVPSDRERQLLKEQIEEDGHVDKLVVGRIKELDADILVDGYTRADICEELEIEPPTRLRKFETLQDAIDWARRNQRGRRNLYESEQQEVDAKLVEQQERLAQRVARVAELKAAGQSTRLIADAVGISQKQVRNDLATAGEYQNENWYSPENDNGATNETVKGKDGKTYAAKKKKKTRKKKVKQGAIVEERDAGDDTESEAAANKAWAKTPEGKAAKKALAGLDCVTRWMNDQGLFAKHRMALQLLRTDLVAARRR